MSQFLDDLNSYLRPKETGADRVTREDLEEMGQAFGNIGDPNLLNLYLSPEAMERLATEPERLHRCNVCGGMVSLPIMVNGELQPFFYHVTPKDVEEGFAPATHPQCEIVGW